jgi:hypothetical protein
MSVFSQTQPHRRSSIAHGRSSIAHGRSSNAHRRRSNAYRRSSIAESFGRVAKTIDKFIEAWTEAYAMAREAQRRYPFAVE